MKFNMSDSEKLQRRELQQQKKRELEQRWLSMPKMLQSTGMSVQPELAFHLTRGGKRREEILKRTHFFAWVTSQFFPSLLDMVNYVPNKTGRIERIRKGESTNFHIDRSGEHIQTVDGIDRVVAYELDVVSDDGLSQSSVFTGFMDRTVGVIDKRSQMHALTTVESIIKPTIYLENFSLGIAYIQPAYVVNLIVTKRLHPDDKYNNII